MAKPAAGTYEPNKRVMLKVKHERECDCVVAGFRWHKNGDGRRGRLAAARPLRRRRRRCSTSACARASPTRSGASSWSSSRRTARTRSRDHPWKDWAERERPTATAQRMPGRAEPLEPGQGSVVGAAAARARGRGRLRPHAGQRASATPRSSGAGAPTSSRATAPTRSSRSSPPHELAAIFATGR